MDLWGKLKGKSNSDLKARISDYGLEDTLRKYLHNLSTGQRKMVCNLLATSFNARTILLDEPFENVDQSKRVKFLKEIIAMDCEIIMVTHEIHLLRYLKGWTLYFMVDGSLWGKFNAVDVERIYISRGRVENAVVSFNTELGEVSITMDQGGMQLVRAGSLSNALEGVAMDAF
jgi:ABC-type lipoprotein export system ATPase subunit